MEAIGDFWTEKWKDLTHDLQDDSGCVKPVDEPEKKQEDELGGCCNHPGERWLCPGM